MSGESLDHAERGGGAGEGVTFGAGADHWVYKLDGVCGPDMVYV